LYADEQIVHDEPFSSELTRSCAFVSLFEYSWAE
jgi:hypothetical protein